VDILLEGAEDLTMSLLKEEIMVAEKVEKVVEEMELQMDLQLPPGPQELMIDIQKVQLLGMEFSIVALAAVAVDIHMKMQGPMAHQA
jgi:hypothetical protein